MAVQLVEDVRVCFVLFCFPPVNATGVLAPEHSGHKSDLASIKNGRTEFYQDMYLIMVVNTRDSFPNKVKIKRNLHYQSAKRDSVC